MKRMKQPTILVIFRFGLGLFSALYDLTCSRVLDIVLGLASKQLFRRLFQIFLSTILGQDSDFAGGLELLLLFLELLVKDFALSWVGVQVDVVTTSSRLPRKQLKFLNVV